MTQFHVTPQDPQAPVTTLQQAGASSTPHSPGKPGGPKPAKKVKARRAPAHGKRKKAAVVIEGNDVILQLPGAFITIKKEHARQTAAEQTEHTRPAHTPPLDGTPPAPAIGLERFWNSTIRVLKWVGTALHLAALLHFFIDRR